MTDCQCNYHTGLMLVLLCAMTPEQVIIISMVPNGLSIFFVT